MILNRFFCFEVFMTIQISKKDLYVIHFVIINFSSRKITLSFITLQKYCFAVFVLPFQPNCLFHWKLKKSRDPLISRGKFWFLFWIPGQLKLPGNGHSSWNLVNNWIWKESWNPGGNFDSFMGIVVVIGHNLLRIPFETPNFI